MDVLEERRRITPEYLDKLRGELSESEQEAVNGILRSLKPLNTSVAGAVCLLHICEDIIYKASAMFGD